MRYLTSKYKKLKRRQTDCLKSKREEGNRWRKPLRDLDNNRSTGKIKNVRLNPLSSVSSPSSGRSAMKSWPSPSSKNGRKSDSVPSSSKASTGTRWMLSNARLKKSIRGNLKKLLGLKHYLINKRRTSTHMLSKQSENGKVKAKMSSLWFLNSKTIRNKLYDKHSFYYFKIIFVLFIPFFI